MSNPVLTKAAVRSKITSDVTELFRTASDNGSVTPESFKVLGETLSFVPEELRKEAMTNKIWSSPEQCYAWAIANSTLVFPYLSLKIATEKLRNRLDSAVNCGLRPDGKFHMPKSESVSQSACWNLIIELLRRTYGGENVICDVDMSTELPDILQDEIITKNPAISTILIRIMELQKSPFSATIRKDISVNENAYKNSVDFVALEYLSQKMKGYENLSISEESRNSGRRSIKVNIGTSGGRTTLVPRNTGYKLCDYLASYIHRRSSKDPESEDFCKLFLGLIRDIYKDTEIPEKFEIPKSFFHKPSEQIRNGIRHGPVIKTRSGNRQNLYIPFSFVKAAECALYPEATKQNMTKLGQEILENLDTINSKTPSEASSLLPFFREYLRSSYLASDECRKQWRRNQYVPGVAQLRTAFADEFKTMIAAVKDGKLTESEYTTKVGIKVTSLNFTNPFSNDEQRDEARASVNSVLERIESAKRQPGRPSRA